MYYSNEKSHKILMLASFFLLGCESKDWKNLKKIQIGMTSKTVRQIMGNPIDISDSMCADTSQFRYQYNNPDFAASDNFHIYFSKRDSTVQYIHYGD